VNLLLWVDLEGVAGVDHIAELVEPSESARAQLAAELEVVCAGFARVLVVDTHRSEKPSVTRLPKNAELVSGLDARADAVACLGMHAADTGFVPHTMDLCCCWELEGRPVSEAELWLGLAAERGLPVVFVSGDESLRVRAPFVATKRALSASRAVSRPVEEVHAELRRAAAATPTPAPRLEGELTVRFRSAWMAPSPVRLSGATLEARIAHGEQWVERVGALLGPALRPWALEEDVAALAERPFTREQAPSYAAQARRALAAVLARTREGEHELALRALTLHMLEGHAPAFFAEQRLLPVLEATVAALEVGRFDEPSDPGLMMSRLDALYVLRERGHAAPVDDAALERCIAEVFERDATWGWLLGELAHQLKLPGRIAIAPRPFRQTDRVEDLYWLTHLFLLETRYLRRPLPREGFEAMTEELLLAVPFVLAQGEMDLAAELAFCLAAAHEDRSPLLAALAQAQASDGSVDSGETSHVTHCTCAALLAFATAA
jgi:D-amino peptidase